MVAPNKRWLGTHTNDNANLLTSVSFYQLVRSGWFSVPTSSGGLLPLLGISLSGGSRLSVVEALDPLFSDEASTRRWPPGASLEFGRWVFKISNGVIFFDSSTSDPYYILIAYNGVSTTYIIHNLNLFNI
jgi:hypothetical protein